MKQINIKEFNKKCAKFIGYKLTSTDRDFSFYEHPDGKGLVFQSTHDKDRFDSYPMLEVMGMLFHRDWNWITRVVEKIEITNRINDNEYYPYMVTVWKNCCNISDGNNGSIIIENYNVNKKEAVVQAIDKFIDWYNQNKK